MKNVNNVDARKSTALLYYIANKLFGRQWLFEKVEQINTNGIETDHDSEELSPVIKRRQKEIENLQGRRHRGSGGGAMAPPLFC